MTPVRSRRVSAPLQPLAGSRPGGTVRALAGAALALMALSGGEAAAQSAVFDHTATAANIFGSRTYISHPLINARPEAVFFVTHHWNPPGQAPKYNDHPVGVVYVGLAQQRWAITNRDGGAMAAGTTFTVWIPEEGTTGSFSFRHTTTAGNVLGNLSYIDHPVMNANPGLYVNVTPVFESTQPEGEFGIWYEAGAQRYTVFRQSTTEAMPTGLSFNICVGSCGILYWWWAASVECPANPSGSNVCALLSAPSLTHEDRLLISGGWSGVYLDQPTGIYWSSALGEWGIFLEDTTADAPEGAKFYVKATELIYRNEFETGTFFGWTLP